MILVVSQSVLPRSFRRSWQARQEAVDAIQEGKATQVELTKLVKALCLGPYILPMRAVRRPILDRFLDIMSLEEILLSF